MALINCPECSKQISDQAASCVNCGHPIAKVNVDPVMTPLPTKSRSIAVMLAIFLGGIGIHKFYLNKPGQGVLYILFCWTLIPIFLGWIEAIQYLLVDDNTFHERYVKGIMPNVKVKQSTKISKPFLILLGACAVVVIIVSLFNKPEKKESTSLQPVRSDSTKITPNLNVTTPTAPKNSRQSYVDKITQIYSKKGINIYTSMEGKNHDVLRIKFLGPREKAYEYMKTFVEERIKERAMSSGFKDVKSSS